MVTGTLVGPLTPVVAIGPTIKAVFNGPTRDKLDNGASSPLLGYVTAAANPLAWSRQEAAGCSKALRIPRPAR